VGREIEYGNGVDGYSFSIATTGAEAIELSRERTAAAQRDTDDPFALGGISYFFAHITEGEGNEGITVAVIVGVHSSIVLPEGPYPAVRFRAEATVPETPGESVPARFEFRDGLKPEVGQPVSNEIRFGHFESDPVWNDFHLDVGARNTQPFVRADTNLDGRIDISDSIAIFGHLFLGSGPVPCLDAAAVDDSAVDDSGVVELTDRISLNNFLFLGGTAPASPMECGYDVTEDALDCAESECLLISGAE